MTSKPSIEESRKAIIDAMKSQGYNFTLLAKKMNVRGEKLAAAVKCTTGITPTTIELRKKAAETLGLDPYKVWNQEYLSYTRKRPTGDRSIKVKPADQLTEEEWDKLPPRMRVRALCQSKGITLKDLEKQLGVTYRMLTSAIYGAKEGYSLRKRISRALHHPMSEIWPDLHKPQPKAPAPSIQRASNSEEMDTFYGFGDLSS